MTFNRTYRIIAEIHPATHCYNVLLIDVYNIGCAVCFSAVYSPCMCFNCDLPKLAQVAFIFNTIHGPTEINWNKYNILDAP